MSRRSLIIYLREQGYTYKQIGEFLDISRQRVHQIFARYKSPYKNYHKKSILLDDFIRIEVMRRDKFTCKKCGYKGFWRDFKLCVHHKDRSGQTENPNNSLKNLITLCSSCHSKAHGGENKKTPLDKQKLIV